MGVGYNLICECCGYKKNEVLVGSGKLRIGGYYEAFNCLNCKQMKVILIYDKPGRIKKELDYHVNNIKPDWIQSAESIEYQRVAFEKAYKKSKAFAKKGPICPKCKKNDLVKNGKREKFTCPRCGKLMSNTDLILWD